MCAATGRGKLWVSGGQGLPGGLILGLALLGQKQSQELPAKGLQFCRGPSTDAEEQHEAGEIPSETRCRGKSGWRELNDS